MHPSLSGPESLKLDRIEIYYYTDETREECYYYDDGSIRTEVISSKDEPLHDIDEVVDTIKEERVEGVNGVTSEIVKSRNEEKNLDKSQKKDD